MPLRNEKQDTIQGQVVQKLAIGLPVEQYHRGCNKNSGPEDRVPQRDLIRPGQFTSQLPFPLIQ